MERWFLSYNSQDPLHEQIQARLRSLPDTDLFYAPASLRAGGYWLPTLADEIHKAEAFLLLVGEKGLGPWQVLEYYEALDRRVKQPGFPVVVLLLQGQPAPGLPFLRQLHWIVEPDLTAEVVIGKIRDAVAGQGSRPGELWRYTAPYRGLHAMTEADSGFFFGRTSETVATLRAIADHPGCLALLIGNSGVGKSSFAQAGVIAALKRQAFPERSQGAGPWPVRFQNSRQWVYLTLKPGTDPLRALVEPFLRTWRLDPKSSEARKRRKEWVADLTEGGLGLADLLDATEEQLETELGQAKPPAFLLYVDQGEELYARSEGGQRRRFSEVLAQGLSDPRLFALMSLRADFLGALQNDAPLFQARQQIDVPPLREAELLEVVSQPAKLLGARFEPDHLASDLARRTAEESVTDAGALPLLSYLLDDMWTQMVRRSDGMLRLEAQAIELGGVLAKRADEFLGHNPKAEDRLRRILTLKLATVREDGEPTRRRAGRSEFSDEEWQLVSELAGEPYRLLVTATPEAREPCAEVAHEAIFKRWQTLRDWITAEREFLIWKTGLEADRRQWEATPESDKSDALLMGVALAQGQSWLAKRAEDLSRADREFINLSIARDVREREQKEQDRKQKERFQRLALMATVAALLLVTTLAGLSWYQWGEAEQREKEAESQKRVAQEQLNIARDTLKVQVRAVTEDLRNDAGIQNKTLIRLLDRTKISFEELLSRLKDDPRFGGDRAEMLHNYGVAYVVGGDTSKAESSFHESLKQFRELLDRAPSELEWRRGVAEQLDQLGQVHIKQDENERALARQEYEQSLRLREEIAEDAPDEWKTHLDISSSQYNLGEYFMSVSQPQEALNRFNKAQENADKALGLAKDDAKALKQINLRRARVLVSLSEVYAALKKGKQNDQRVALGKAQKAALEKALEIRITLHELNQNDREITRDLSWTYHFLGVLAIEDEELNLAEQYFQQCFKLRSEAVTNDPSDRAKHDLAWAQLNYGNVLRRLKRYNDARQQLKMASDLMRQVAERDKLNLMWRKDFCMAQVSRGDLEMDLLNPNEALSYYQEAGEIFENLINLSDRPQFRMYLGIVYEKISSAKLLAGNPSATEADRLLDQATKALKALPEAAEGGQGKLPSKD